MILCPVCEHTQAAGDECELCGKRFAVRAEAGEDVLPMADLELTPHPGGGAEVPAQRLAELEQTRLLAGPDLPPAAFPEMERTGQDPGGDAEAAELEDLDRGRAVDDGARTEVPWGAVTCRYCRHQQVEGVLCDRCGMRLPRFGPDGAPALVGLPLDAESLQVRCRCGAKARPGRRCLNCGEMVAVPTEA